MDHAAHPREERAGLDAEHHPLPELAGRVAVAVGRLVLAGARPVRHELAPPRLAQAGGDNGAARRLAELADERSGPGGRGAGLDRGGDRLERALELGRRLADGHRPAHVAVVAVDARSAIQEDGLTRSHRPVAWKERPERGPRPGPRDGGEAELGPGRADRVLRGGGHLDLARPVAYGLEARRHPQVGDTGGLGQERDLGRALEHPQAGGERRCVIQPDARCAGAEGIHGGRREQPHAGQPGRRAAAQAGRRRSSQIAGKHDLVADSLLARPVDVGGRVGQERHRAVGRHEQERLLLLDAEPVGQVAQVARRVVDVGSVADECVEPGLDHPLAHARDPRGELLPRDRPNRDHEKTVPGTVIARARRRGRGGAP